MANRENNDEKARNGPLWEPIVWLGFAGFALYLTFDFDGPLSTFRFGAAFWPRVVIGIIAIAGCVLLGSRFVTGREPAERETETAFFNEGKGIGRITPFTLAMFALPLVWVYGMHKIGFLLVTPFFLFAFTWLMGVRRLKILFGFSLGFYAALVLVFYKLIFTPLPMGAGMFNTLNGEILALIQ